MYWRISPCCHVVSSWTWICSESVITKGCTVTLALSKSQPPVSTSSIVMSDDIRASQDDESTNSASCGSLCSAFSTKYPVGYRRCIVVRDAVNQSPPAVND